MVAITPTRSTTTKARETVNRRIDKPPVVPERLPPWKPRGDIIAPITVCGSRVLEQLRHALPKGRESSGSRLKSGTPFEELAPVSITRAPVMGSSDGTAKVVNIKPAYVFDISQTDERTQRAAA